MQHTKCLQKRMGLAHWLSLAAAVIYLSGCHQLSSDSPFDADGSLTTAELEYFLAGIEDAPEINAETALCIREETGRRAALAGDPQTIDPKSLTLPEEDWVALEKSDKRVILTQIVVSAASVFCTTGRDM